MKAKVFGLMIVAVVLASFFGAAQPLRAEVTAAQADAPPAILTSLESGLASQLDDIAAAGVRGEAKYVMTHLLAYNYYDYYFNNGSHGYSATWTTSPWSWRYGNWGGYHYSNGIENPQIINWGGSYVDGMDYYFRKHDNEVWLRKPSADSNLLNSLKNGLPLTYNSDWNSWIYVSHPLGTPDAVVVVNMTLLGMTVYKSMPFSEYARRQAMTAFQSGFFAKLR